MPEVKHITRLDRSFILSLQSITFPSHLHFTDEIIKKSFKSYLNDSVSCDRFALILIVSNVSEWKQNKIKIELSMNYKLQTANRLLISEFHARMSYFTPLIYVINFNWKKGKKRWINRVSITTSTKKSAARISADNNLKWNALTVFFLFLLFLEKVSLKSSKVNCKRKQLNRYRDAFDW